MDWSERQEYYDLIEEEIQFKPEKGQKWLLTFEERHTFGSDILFHVYTHKGDTYIQVHEVVNVMELEVEERLHKMSDTLSGNFRIHMSTLKRELPTELKHEAHARDGSRFKLTLMAKEKMTYEWEFPTGGFERIQPVLKLIWGVDSWKEGAEAMGWIVHKGKRPAGKEGESPKSMTGRKDPVKKDPFGKDIPTTRGSRNWPPGKKEGRKEEPKPRKGSSQKGRLDPFGSRWDWNDK